jgi:hypothetical protein
VAGNHEGRVVRKDEMTKWLNKSITFYYSPTLYTNGSSWWLNVKSERVRSRMTRYRYPM